MNNLETIQAEVAELESKRAHNVLFERAAKAIIEFGQGRIVSAKIQATVGAHIDGDTTKSNYEVVLLSKDIGYFVIEHPTLSECLREIAQEFAPEAKKGGE